MTDLLWPGDHRAGAALSDRQVAAAMVQVEYAWLTALTEAGIAPPSARPQPWPGAAGSSREDPPRDWALTDADVASLAVAGEGAGNPAVPLVALLRGRLPEPAATWLHRGLTSQDVVDSALMLCLRDAADSIIRLLRQQVSSMTMFVTEHRRTPMLARTLTQPAIPTTLGARAAGWLTGILDAADDLTGARAGLRVQIGGAAGTLAAVVELAGGRGLADPPAVAMRTADALAQRLGLAPSIPWHTARRPITRIGDALAGCTDAFGRIARDVLTASRAEIGELHEGFAPGRGGSSTLPGKHNPVLSVLIHRAALAAPALAATLHLAAATANDDRPDGAWHTEWATLRTLTRRTLTAADQSAELLAGLTADVDAMARNLAQAAGAHAEQRAMAEIAGAAPADSYLGATDLIIARAIDRARRFTTRGEP